ncbi:FAD binding domain-containing protein [Thozetella sp. PMI_491]|nr:FAD binding domain-containing protein [Thozetella sp. PMI_491]
MGSTSDLRIVIVGGGIAGLSTAISLRAPNRHILVLEKSRMLREVGAAISLQPNASKIVGQWGIDAFLDKAEPMHDKAFRVLDIDGQLVNEIAIDTTKLFGANRVLYHRQDLHTALREAATAPNLSGKPAELRTSSAVVACDPEAGTVTLESGEVITGDIIIGADGIHSAVRAAVLGETRKAIPTGISAYRMLMETSVLEGLSFPAAFSPKEPVTTMIIAHSKRVIMGPARGGKVFGIVALVPDENMHEQSSTESWVEEGSMEKLMEVYADFPEWVKNIFKTSPDLALWQLRDLDPLPGWVKGRAIIIGDASHAMLPTQGQGASQSIEDAEALQAFLTDIDSSSSAEQITGALQRVFNARYDRASLIQKYSRQQAKPATDLGSNAVTLNPGEFMKYNCDYLGALDWENRQAEGRVQQ